MTYADDGMSAIKVEIFRTFLVPHMATLATINGDVEKGINVE